MQPYDSTTYNVYGSYTENSSASATGTNGYYSYTGGKTVRGFYISVFGGSEGQECSYYACGKLGYNGPGWNDGPIK